MRTLLQGDHIIPAEKGLTLISNYKSDFLLAMVKRFFENVALSAHGENHMCSHPCTDNVTSLYFVAKSTAW